MDARQRLNQLRRFKSRDYKNKFNKNKQQLNDLRELIQNNNNINNNSVKNRIGFNTKYKRLKRKQHLINAKNQNKGQKDRRNKRVLLSDDKRIIKVSVDLSQIEDKPKPKPKPRNTSNRMRAEVNPKKVTKNESKRRFKTNVSTTQPIIIPQFVGQTSLPAYVMPSSAPIRPKTYYSTNESNNSVLVSNLNKTITYNDINELFGEIGPIVRVTKINSSVAIIVYENGMDARNACQTYHNRLLDGMPMQCNTLSHSGDEYAIEMQPKIQSTSLRQNSGLLESQLRQINALQPQPNKMTAAQAFTNRRPNNPNVRFTVNV